jgi:CheY-like chemotaxis protein
MYIEDIKVLVVDDDDTMRMFVVNQLARLDVLHVQVAIDGKDGLLKADLYRPDVIILDIHMTPINGLEFIQQLNIHPVIELRHIPVLILTADSSTEMFNDSVPLGIVGYIIKPPDVSTLKVKLVRALKIRGM